MSITRPNVHQSNHQKSGVDLAWLSVEEESKEREIQREGKGFLCPAEGMYMKINGDKNVCTKVTRKRQSFFEWCGRFLAPILITKLRSTRKEDHRRRNVIEYVLTKGWRSNNRNIKRGMRAAYFTLYMQWNQNVSAHLPLINNFNT